VGRVLFGVAIGASALGVAAWLAGRADVARWAWTAGTIPILAGLGFSILRDFAQGRVGVDAVAFVSMAAAILLGEALAGVVVAVMYSGGNLLEDFAVSRAAGDLRSLVDRAPRVAHRLLGGHVADIPVEKVASGDRLLVRSGEVIPADGILLSPEATIDESALTGEPLPVLRIKGEPLRSGAVNAGNTFELSATATSGESTYAGIIGMVTAAQTAKAPFIRLADRYALILLPITLFLAGAAWAVSGDPIRGLAVLVTSTPCPLILAAPVAFIGGVSRAARLGILIKGGAALEALARTHTVMFDKTGTLTVGGARLVAIEVAPGEKTHTILALAASLEQASHHVVGEAIVSAARSRGLQLETPVFVREKPGSGLEGKIGNKTVRAGSFDLVCGRSYREPWALRALRRATWRSALSVFVAVDGRVIGALLLADELRPETPRAVQSLRLAGAARIVMVTGDRADVAETIGAALDLDAILADRDPADKVDAVASEQRVNPTVMVGDGINDAPALAAADVGIAMGARGASASSEAADVVILVDRLDRVSDAVSIAKRSRRIAEQSIAAGMSLSGIAMLVAAFGWLSPVGGALTQEAIDVAVIANALRALSPGWKKRREGLRPTTVRMLYDDHRILVQTLDRLREIADALDDAEGKNAIALIREANNLVSSHIVEHERQDESVVYPKLAKVLPGDHGLAAMSRAHREILHLARMLRRLTDDLAVIDPDRYVIRDAQRAIESTEALVRIHSAQEDDIYEHAAAT
jgi:heavy metal translocating P-type ATPase